MVSVFIAEKLTEGLWITYKYTLPHDFLNFPIQHDSVTIMIENKNIY